MMRGHRGIRFWVAGLFLLPGVLAGQARMTSHPAQLVGRNGDPDSPLQPTRSTTRLYESTSTLIELDPTANSGLSRSA